MYVSRNLFISLNCPICCCIILVSYDPCIFVASCNLFWFWVFSLLVLVSLPKGLSTLSFQGTSLVSWIVSITFLVSISFIFALIVVFPFLLPPLGFVLFLVPWGIKAGCLSLFMFLEVGIYYYELPSWNCFYSIPQILISYIPILICLKVFLNFFFDFFFNPLLFRSMLLNLHI